MNVEFSLKLAVRRTARVRRCGRGKRFQQWFDYMRLAGGSKRIAQEFGCARNTVRRYLREGGVAPSRQPVRRTAFDGLDDWLRERFFRHEGNADVIRQELASEHGIVIGLRSLELRVKR